MFRLFSVCSLLLIMPGCIVDVEDPDIVNKWFCIADEDCLDGFMCVLNRCNHEGTNLPCVENIDCQAPCRQNDFICNEQGICEDAGYTAWGDPCVIDLGKIEGICEDNHNCRPNHCANGEQDEDEEGIDCGGAECPSCYEPLP